MTATCGSCGREFETKRASAKFCGDACRKRAQRAPGGRQAAAQERPAAKPAAPPRAAPVPSGQLVVRTTEALVKVDRLDTYAGQQAIALAQRIESPFETGQAVSSLSKELSRVMDEILSSAAAGGTNPIDELRRRRDAKRAG